MGEQGTNDHWRINVAATAGIMATVLIALVLAQLDALQMRGPGRQRAIPVVNAQATAAAGGSVIQLAYDAPPGTPIALMPDLNPRPDVPPTLAPAAAAGSEQAAALCGQAPSNWLLYTVQPGDTLETLAAGTRTDAVTLATANCLTEGRVIAGMQILLPGELAAPVATAAVESCGPPQWWVRYQVISGDTLSLLAQRRGTTIAAILNANCRDSLNLTAGQMIFLPPGGAGIAPPPPTPTETVVATTTPPASSSPAPRPTTNPQATTPITFPTATSIRPTSTPFRPTSTPPFAPTATATSTPRPTSTPALPTSTPALPTSTPPPPTDTPPPPPTDTPPPPPTDTPPPPPTDTPPPPPTDTPPPPPTDMPPDPPETP